MMKRYLAALAALAFATAAQAQDSNTLLIDISGKANGTVTVELLADVAPQHVARIKTLAGEGAYDNVAFHRVIEGFMAQTGDVEFATRDAFGQGRAGTGGSSYPDLPAEFSDIPFDRGIVGMARAQNPNSANSQFFIMFAEGHFLNGQYTVVGRVTDGMDIVDAIQRGVGQGGSVADPDYMSSVRLQAE